MYLYKDDDLIQVNITYMQTSNVQQRVWCPFLKVQSKLFWSCCLITLIIEYVT